MQKFLRMWDWIVASLVTVGAVWWFAPQQLSIIVFKCCLIAVGTCITYWVDHSLFKRAADRIDGDQPRDLYSSASMLRRALIFLAVMLAIALGV